MPQPKTFLQQAVERLVGVTETMERLFEANYQDEANRTRIQGGVVRYSDEISKHLRNLGQQKGAIAAEIKVANTAYNNFIATWNNGLGDLVKSFTMLREFHRLLNERRAEIDRLINLTPNERSPPDPADKPTAQDLRHFNLIIDVVDELRTLFDAFL
jgi:hypothetical protein